MPSLIRTQATSLPVSDGWFDVTYGVTLAGRLARLQARVDVRAAVAERRRRAHAGELEPGETKRPVIPPHTPARIAVLDGEAQSVAVEFPLESFFPEFDRLPDGRWVVAEPRCSPGELNARVIGPNGVEARFCMGDGVEHVQCDAAGAIWVGYFDEGVFGDPAWARAGLEPIGAAGLLRWTADGEIAWRHDLERERANGYMLTDCCALNVTADEAWCAVYGDAAPGEVYPLIRLNAAGEERVWRPPAFFLVDAIAVAGDLVAAISSKAHDAGQFSRRLTVVRLQGESGELLHDTGLEGFDKPGARRPEAVLGRGCILHVIDGGLWRRLSIGE